MKSITIQIFADPGHAWARFPKARLEKLGIADKITKYSYQRGANAFLEEDCDLSLLMAALKQSGYEVKFKEAHTNRQSKIRSYSQYYYKAPERKTMVVKNLMTGKPVEIEADTPWCCNPASETYWSM
jgi:hypothetical protein